MAESRKIYDVQIAKDAADFVRAQPKKMQRQIMRKINSLAENPEAVEGDPFRLQELDTFSEGFVEWAKGSTGDLK